MGWTSTRTLALAGAVVVLVGCNGPRAAVWWFEMDDDSLRERVVEIEAVVRQGGCSGTTVLYTSRFAPDAVPSAPPTLAAGSYGFAGRARDEDCTWFASGCVDVVLPAAGVTVRLSASPEQHDTCDPPDAGVTDGARSDTGTGLTLQPSNVSATTFTDGGDVAITEDQTFDTDDCASLPGAPITATQTDGPELCVLRATSFSIAHSATVRVVGSRPLVILALEDVMIDGVLDAAAHGTEAGAGGGRGATRSASATGDAPGEAGGHFSTYDDGGGGGGGGAGNGGSGGDGDHGVGGPAGTAVASTWLLSPLRGGSGGGLGGGGESAGAGGAGGGAIQISARGAIHVSGTILVSGGGGRGGTDGTSGDANIGSGGGGGSGGALLLEAITVDVSPSARLWAAGGGGGGGSGCRNSGDGDDGADGRDTTHANAAGGARGPSCDDFNVGAAGGASGGGPTLVGVDGADLTSADGAGGNGGGGGGAAGFILIRDTSSTLPSHLVSSPEVGPGLRSITADVR